MFALSLPMLGEAQSQIQTKIQPSMFEEKVEPGAELVRSVSISNLSEVEQTFFPISRDIVGMGDDLRPIYAEDQEDTEGVFLSSWITFDQKSVTVRPGMTANVRFTIKVPKNASPGSHIAGVFLTYQPEIERQNATGVGYDIGSIINLQIAGEVDVRAMVREFSSSKVVYGEPKVQFTTRIENIGNVFVRPRGLIEIKGPLGRKIDPVLVNENGVGIIPKNTRTFQTNWNPDGFHIGRYAATISLTYGEAGAQQTLYRSVDFWILPLGTLLPFFGALLAFVLVIYVVLRIYIRSQIARFGGGRAASTQRESAQGLSRLAAVVIAILISVIVGLLILFFYFG
jgi:hypothetical protein